MKVLVTGADGFIGSHLTEGLVNAGFDVRAFVCYNSFNLYGWLDTLDKNVMSGVEVVSGDIRDPEFTGRAVRGAERVFHLAALIAIPYSYQAAHSYVETNINGTLNILNAAREYGTSRIMITSTSEVYGTAQYVPIDEKHPFQGQSPYSASKIGADRMAEAYCRSFSMPITIVRPFNNYGPRQSNRAVIPTIITQLLSGADSIRLGKLSPTRDFVFVKDTVECFIRLAACSASIGKEVNISTGKEISIGDLAQALIEIIRPDAKIVCDENRLRPDNSEVDRLLGDNSLLRELIGYAPDTRLKDGLMQTVAWFKKNTGRYKPDIYNI